VAEAAGLGARVGGRVAGMVCVEGPHVCYLLVRAVGGGGVSLAFCFLLGVLLLWVSLFSSIIIFLTACLGPLLMTLS
jgi:hypothetical protein